MGGTQLDMLINWKASVGKARPWLDSRTWAVLALVSANVIWGTTFVITKPMLERVPPITLATGRFAIALLILLPLLAWSNQRPLFNRTTALMGFIGILIVYGCQNLGLTYTGATNGAIIHGGIPVLTVLIAAPALRERLSGSMLAGITLSIVGILVVILRGSRDPFGLSARGDLLVLLSALGLAGYLVLGRKAVPGARSLELITGVLVFGLVFLLPASGIELGMRGMEHPTITDLLGLAYLGAAASALAFMLSAYGLRHFEAMQVATFSNLKPLVGVVFAAFALSEAITGSQIAGGLLILGGVWLTTRQPAGELQRAVTTASGA